MASETSICKAKDFFQKHVKNKIFNQSELIESRSMHFNPVNSGYGITYDGDFYWELYYNYDNIEIQLIYNDKMGDAFAFTFLKIDNCVIIRK